MIHILFRVLSVRNLVSEAFDVWDLTPNPPTLIAGGMDTLDFRAKVDSTKVSLNELTAVDSISGYAVRLYNPLIDQMTEAVLGGDDVAGFSLFENVLTGSGDDIIFGNDNDNLIDSGNGSDVVYGLAGADEIVMHGANGETNLVAGVPAMICIIFREILVAVPIIESLKQAHR